HHPDRGGGQQREHRQRDQHLDQGETACPALHWNTLAVAATLPSPGRSTSTSTRSRPSPPVTVALRRQLQWRPPSSSLPSRGAASCAGCSSCASAATLAATIPASTCSPTRTAVRTLSPDRLSRPTTTRANTA